MTLMYHPMPGSYLDWGGRVVRWCWVNVQSPGRPTIWITVG